MKKITRIPVRISMNEDDPYPEKKGYLYSMHKGEIEEIPIMYYWDSRARKIWRSPRMET